MPNGGCDGQLVAAAASEDEMAAAAAETRLLLSEQVREVHDE